MLDSYSFPDTYLLKGATLGDVNDVKVISEISEFKAGDPILTEKDKGNDIMMVVEGRARVETRDGDLIDELRAGDMIGEIAFLDGKSRTANVTSVGNSKILIIPADRLRELMKNNMKLENTILKNISLALCQRLRDANQQVEALLVPR